MKRHVEKNLRGREYSYDTYKVNKGGKMKKDVITYFTGIKEQLGNIRTMEEEDRAMFIASVHNEIRFREKRLAFHNSCSSILETVLDNSSHSQIKSFFKACMGDFYELFTDRSASHPMQAMLFKVADVMMAEHVTGTILPWEKFIPRDGEESESDEENEAEKKAEEESSNSSSSSDSDSSDSDSSDSDSEEEKAKTKAKAKPEKMKFNRRNPNQGPPISMQDMFISLCDELSIKWARLMANPQGAIVMRTIILILSGRTSINKDLVFSIIKNKNPDAGDSNQGFRRPPKPHSGGVVSSEDKKIEILSQSRSHIKKLRNILPEMVSAISEMEDYDLQSACYRPSIAPVFQTLLISLAERQRKQEHVVTLSTFISRLLGWKAGKGEIQMDESESESESESDSDSSDSDSSSDDEDEKKSKSQVNKGVTDLFKLGPGSAQHVGEMMRHSTASYLLEVIFTSSPDAVLVNFIYKHVIGKLQYLALDNSATHCIQKLFDSLTTESSFTLLFDEIAPHMTEIITRNKAGVIWSVVEASARIGCKHTLVVKALSAAVGVTRSHDKSLFQKILSLDTSAVREKKTMKDENEGEGEEDEDAAPTAETVRAMVEKNKIHVKYLGCRIAQSIFKLSPQSMAPLLSSIHSMNTETVVSLLKDKLGLRVLQAYVLESPASQKEKFKLVKKLEGRFAEIVASNSDAGFFVEKVYFYADIEVKTVIAKDLSQNERRLAGVRGGVPLLKKLRISQYKATYKPYDGEPGFPSINEEKAIAALSAAEKTATRELFSELLQPKQAPTPKYETKGEVSSSSTNVVIENDDDNDDDDIEVEDDGQNDLVDDAPAKPSAASLMGLEDNDDSDDEPTFSTQSLKRFQDDDVSSDDEPQIKRKKSKK